MKKILLVLSTAVMVALAAPAFAGAKQDAVMDHYKKLAKGSFSASRGKAFFGATHTGGKPATPSCTSCHTKSPANTGHTRANKPIAPMAFSKSPDRFGELKKVEKWFGRNCRSVLGRECTVQEKGDFLAFMFSQ